MSDSPRTGRSTITPQELDIERRILRARTAAVDALEQRNWDAVVLSCGKVLQEVARNELPYNEHGGTLPQLLERLARKLQTDQPVSDLAAALKDAGGLRGFFDLESDVDEELARATVSVVESFLTYTYAFREEVRHLNELAAAHRSGAVAEPEPEPRQEPPAESPRERERPVAHGEAPERSESREERPATGAQRRDRPNSVFDQFEDRKDDPIRQTWQPKRSDE